MDTEPVPPGMMRGRWAWRVGCGESSVAGIEYPYYVLRIVPARAVTQQAGVEAWA